MTLPIIKISLATRIADLERKIIRFYPLDHGRRLVNIIMVHILRVDVKKSDDFIYIFSGLLKSVIEIDDSTLVVILGIFYLKL